MICEILYSICDANKFRTKVTSQQEKLRVNIYLKKGDDNGDGEKKRAGRTAKSVRCEGKVTPSCLA